MMGSGETQLLHHYVHLVVYRFVLFLGVHQFRTSDIQSQIRCYKKGICLAIRLIKILTEISLDTRSLYNYILWLKIRSIKIILSTKLWPGVMDTGLRIAS